MNMKKIVSAASALTIAASAFASMGIVANAAETTAIEPAQLVGLTEGGVSTAAPFAINAISISGGKIKTDSKSLLLAKFDYSNNQYFTNTEDYGVMKVELTYTTEIGGDSNSGMAVVNVTGIDSAWTADTMTLADLYTKSAANVVDKNSENLVWSSKTEEVNVVYDITDLVKNDEDKILTLALACTTARAQSIKTVPQLKVTYGAAGEHAYSIDAKAGDKTLSNLASGIDNTGNKYGVTGLHEILTVDGVNYQLDSSVKNHTVTYTMGEADAENVVKYNEIDNMVFFKELEEMDTPSDNDKVAESSALSAGKGLTLNRTNHTVSTEFTAAADGKYTITIPSKNTNSKNRDSAISVTDKASNKELYAATVTVGANGGTNTFAKEFAMAKGETVVITFKCPNNLTPVYDYILVTKTGDLQTIDMKNAGVSNGINHDSVATSFYADLNNEGTITITGASVTSGENTMQVDGGIVLTDAKAVFGLIVNKLADATATATITVK